MLHWPPLLATPGDRLVPERRADQVGPTRPREGDSGNVTEYEILLMLDPDAATERHDEIIARTRELVEKSGGRWLAHDPWGRRRLAFEIDHKHEGVYHLLTFATEASTLDEVSRVLKITDGVMRHMAVRRPKGGGTRTGPPPPVEVSQPREYAPESSSDSEEGA
jgi:small subunit ribosomal protein S6